MTDRIHDVILGKFKQIAQGASLPSGIQFLPEHGGTIVMSLSPQAMGAAPAKNLNMQCDSAAFEAWALLIHVHCGFRVILTWREEPTAEAYRGHYGRFLYRAMKFAGQYPDWFALSPALEGRVNDFRTFLHTHSFYNNIPAGLAGNNNHAENRMERLFAEECAPILRTIAEQGGISLRDAPICRQLPVGLFEGKKSEETRVFTDRKSAIDLWTTSGDSIVIFELKAENAKAGILTELMFYANYMADLYVNDNTFTPLAAPAAPAPCRGYRQLFPLRFGRVQAAILTDRLHPLITPEVLREMNRGTSNIQYYYLRYTLDENGRPVPGACV